MKFGFLIDKTEVTCSGFTIKPLPDYAEIVDSFYSNVHVSKGWIYGPEKELVKNADEKKKFSQCGPIMPDSFYRMIATHEIVASSGDEEYLRFLVLGYGFLQGLYLTPEGYSCIGRVPYQPGKLNGLILCGNDYRLGMEKVSNFYLDSNDDKRNQMFACMHWFLVGQTYQNEWDKFDAQYKVLDGLYRLSGLTAPNHANRPVVLANNYGITLPDWAVLDATGKESALSRQRNELVHEAKFDGHPIGYSYPSENYTLEFSSFNAKLIAASLEIDTSYLHADPKNRDMWGWDIKQ